jgi:hypothetical protein
MSGWWGAWTSTQALGESRDAQSRYGFDLVHEAEALATVQRFRRLVRRAGLNDRARGIRVDREHSAHEGGTDPTAKVRRINHETVHVDRFSVELPRRASDETIADERTEKLLATLLQLPQRFLKWRNRIRADQRGLYPVGPPLEIQDLTCDGRVREIQRNDLHRRHARPRQLAAMRGEVR